MDVVPYAAHHRDGIAALCRDLGWPTYSDPAVVEQGCTAPGVSVCVACVDGEVIGFAQAMGDGVMQSFLSQLGVAPAHRRRGVARALVEEVFVATETSRMDLLTDEAQDFYRSFAHREKSGFRIYPG
ncbi:MAG: GNAT family N-acetyltransferase [Actinobacteria bacterium]|uniref:Unannotated protein n=1 Tax=freshwater metagenome TaxID=449393 RepID=A0A6J6PNX0_9ZZZZ|nr:GNAT family N-acetyltransferase [Actinomycetota bacterium]